MHRLPIAILRQATLVGDSRTGEVDRLDHGPYLLVLLVVTTPPDLALPLPGLGNEAAEPRPRRLGRIRASVAIGRDPRAPGGTYHVVDRRPLSARRAFDLMARSVGRRGLVGGMPTNLAKVLLRTPGLDRIAKSPRAFLDTLTTSVSYESTHADGILESLGVEECPPLEAYVDKMIEVVQKRAQRRRLSKTAAEDGVDPFS